MQLICSGGVGVEGYVASYRRKIFTICQKRIIPQKCARFPANIDKLRIYACRAMRKNIMVNGTNGGKTGPPELTVRTAMTFIQMSISVSITQSHPFHFFSIAICPLRKPTYSPSPPIS